MCPVLEFVHKSYQTLQFNISCISIGGFPHSDTSKYEIQLYSKVRLNLMIIFLKYTYIAYEKVTEITLDSMV